MIYGPACLNVIKIMGKKDLNNFIDKMKEAIYGAGEMALRYQGEVKNLKKEVEKLSRDNDFVEQQRTAKTVMDERVQEELLSAAVKLLDAKAVYLDAEEETPGKKYFSAEPTVTTLVIDPLDGTLRYIRGEDGYSICVGLIENGAILTSLVYFPARKDFYFIKDGLVYCETDNKLRELSAPKVKSDALMYVNNRVGSQIADNLIKEGFKVMNDGVGMVSWPDALIKCIKGEYSACIFHSPQTRDVLLGAMVSKIAGGYACDWVGNKITWPNGGRIPQIMFGFNPIPEKALSCLKV